MEKEKKKSNVQKKKGKSTKQKLHQFFRPTAFSKKQSSTLLPLLHVLREMPYEYRLILFSHLDAETKDLLKKMLRNVLLSNNPIREINQEEIALHLEPFSSDICSLFNSSSFKKHNEKCLIKIGGAPFDSILNCAIPLLLCMNKC